MSSDRRAFVKSLAVASFGGTMTLRQVVAAAAAAGKPPLTNVQFNQRFAALRGTPQFRQEVAAAKGDLVGFLAKNFYLRPDQVEDIRRLPPADIAALNAGLDQAAARNLTLRMESRAVGCLRFSRLQTEVTGNAVIIELLPAVQR
jgi:hypothetical protein